MPCKLQIYPRETAKELKHSIQFPIQMDTSDIVVIYGGCKDISPRENQEKLTEEEIAKEIISIGSCCQDKGVNEIIISGLTCCKGQYHNSRVLKVNYYLHHFCFENKFYFIDNSKIKRDHLFRDGSHLLESGEAILANNFIHYSNSIYSVYFDRNLWNLECRGTEERGSTESLTKRISGRVNSHTNVLENDLDLIDAKKL